MQSLLLAPFDNRTKSLQDDAISMATHAFGCQSPGGHMKGLFPQYDASTQIDFKSAWKEAVFVFDTNVLLNLYRYQENTRDELLSVLQELSEKIWIPFHVALEFQRNRLTVITTQGKKFSEVRKSIEKIKSSVAAEAARLNLAKRHTLIDFDSLTVEFDNLAQKFLEQLDNSQKTQQKLTAPDILKNRIEDLFENRVGPSPVDQKTVDDLFKAAEQRYKFKTPPGYMDSKKDEDSPDEFVHSGIVYKRKYGDYLIWTQLLDFAKSQNKTKIIFVTDDAKEDWWLKYNLEGTKTIGPRPELIEEASLIGGISTFIMYNPESFMQYAQDFLKTEISETTLEDVRDTSIENIIRKESYKEFLTNAIANKNMMHSWILSLGGTPVPDDKFDLLIEHSNYRSGYETRPFTISRAIFKSSIKMITESANRHIKDGTVQTYTMVFSVRSISEINELLDLLHEYPVEGISDTLLIAIGVIEDSSETFAPFLSGKYNDFAGR
ncbi:PIN domain-containing protein [Pseudomonas koreensis]|uniref:PIN-like domain-containing protein n=1 Tax=Pseudomonas koreensis TaxID=198620 RepID=UPI0030179743